MLAVGNLDCVQLLCCLGAVYKGLLLSSVFATGLLFIPDVSSVVINNALVYN